MPVGDRRARIGNSARQVGIVLAVPGAVVTFAALLAAGSVWGTPFWPGVVSGVGLCYAGVGTLLNPDGVVEEASDVEFDHYSVETPAEAVWVGRGLVALGVLVVVTSLLL